MPEPEPVIQTDQQARENEERIRQLDNGKFPEVARVNEMREYREQGEGEREIVKKP